MISVLIAGNILATLCPVRFIDSFDIGFVVFYSVGVGEEACVAGNVQRGLFQDTGFHIAFSTYVIRRVMTSSFYVLHAEAHVGYNYTDS